MTPNPDDGSADPRVVAALEAAAATGGNRADLVEVLRGARLLVAVTQLPNATEMSMVLFKSADGRTGLPAFSSLAALRDWQPTARPLPRPARELAQDCREHGYSALLIDLASPHRTAITGIELAALSV